MRRRNWSPARPRLPFLWCSSGSRSSVSGPAIGGVIAGLPIVLGPGFYILAQREPPAFVADAATYSLMSLSETQVFLTVYLLRVSVIASFGLAVVAWLVAAVPLRLLPQLPALGIVLFTIVTIVGRKIARLHRNDGSHAANKEVLVASITAGGARLGPSWSGLLLAFPVGFSVIAVTVHRRHGGSVLTATLHSALRGTLSLAAFCATLAV
jgi:uncharacterized membrane protein (GlpM family)